MNTNKVKNDNNTRQYEEKFLKLKFAENQIFSSALSFNDIINFLKDNTLPLEMLKDDGTKVLDDLSIVEIEKVVPCLLKIVDKPRSFIKTLEKKVPVEIAKKINYKAISKLSRDCNDWYARTVLTVKPKKIVSDIHEETVNLYENRFICSLIDRISNLIVQTRLYYEKQSKKIDDNIAINAINRKYNYTTDSFKFYNNISKNISFYDNDTGYKTKVEDELKRIKKLEKKVKVLKSSVLYKLLHKQRKVTDPIQKTNILMFEYNYNQAYKLWKYLNSDNKEQKLELKIESDETAMKIYYKLYCFICILASLHDLNFKETSNNKIYFNKDSLELMIKPSEVQKAKDFNKSKQKEKEGESLIFEKDSIIIKLSITNEYIKCSLSFENLNKNNQKKIIDDFYFYPDYTNFEIMNRSDVTDKTKDILNKLVDDSKFTNTTSKYGIVSIDMNICSEDNSFSDKVYRRFYSMGNNFSPEEEQNDLDKWASYKTGISIISPMDLRNNFLNLERIFNYHLIKNTNFEEKLSICPLCGGRNISQNNQNDYTCYDCSHNISITYCNNCDTSHKRPIFWVKYKDEKFLELKEITEKLSNMKIFDKLSRIETIMGEKATTAFELEKETSGWKLKTICPYCGKQLGETR